jgi:hypothetical protein
MNGRAHRDLRAGAALVEFALVSLVVYVLVAAGVELGRMIFVSQVLQDAARIAARELAVTPLPATEPFETALEEPAVKARVWNGNLLVVDLTCYADDAALDAYWSSLPVVNRALRPVFITENLDLGIPPAHDIRRIMRYPGALLKLSAPPANPCPVTYDPSVSTANPTDLSVAIPRVTSRDPGDGRETGIELVPIVAEVRCDPAAANSPLTDTTSPFRLDSVSGCPGTAITPGIVALMINYPFQSGALSYFRPNPDGRFEPNAGLPIVADDAAALAAAPAPGAGLTYVSPQSVGPGLVPGAGIYTGPLGLGTQAAYAQPVRPYRNLITGQAIYRREVFLP